VSQLFYFFRFSYQVQGKHLAGIGLFHLGLQIGRQIV